LMVVAVITFADVQPKLQAKGQKQYDDNPAGTGAKNASLGLSWSWIWQTF
jgi:hypothetical protein